MLLHTPTMIFFKEQSCAYLVEIWPLVPTAWFCASGTNNSTTSGILKLGTLHASKKKKITGAWLDLCLSLVLADFWLVCLPI